MSDNRRHIRLVVFDWAGTLVDDGCRAPVQVIREVLQEKGIILEEDVIRESMGLRKRDHLVALLNQPAVRALWVHHQGSPWTEGDVDDLHDALEERLPQVAQKASRPIPGVVTTLHRLKDEGLLFGSTTGYSRRTMVAVTTANQDWATMIGAVVTADDVSQGRPWPWMIYRNMEVNGVYPPGAVVKVGDTVQDIQEARNAGVWAVGVLLGGNTVGLTTAEWKGLAREEQDARLSRASQTLKQAGAHSVIRSMEKLPETIQQFNLLMEKEGLGIG